MNDIHLYNTLTNRLERFESVHRGEVRIYTCGPTVYAFAHIGNFRTFVFQDVLRRFLQSRGYRVLQVMNVTDVDDRIIQNAAQAGIGHPRIHRKIHSRISRGHRCAAHRTAGRTGACHRSYR